MYRHSIALALLLAAPSAHAAMADLMQVPPDTSYRIITDTDGRPEGPQTINGCRLDPDASCPGTDLSRQGLLGMNPNGADLTGARLVRANLHGALLKGATLTGADCAGRTFRKAVCRRDRARRRPGQIWIIHAWPGSTSADRT